ncbi:hypothetical protein T439DRAFT_10661 [Meredithblackwellia eburnea MCA 4105]
MDSLSVLKQELQYSTPQRICLWVPGVDSKPGRGWFCWTLLVLQDWNLVSYFLHLTSILALCLARCRNLLWDLETVHCEVFQEALAVDFKGPRVTKSHV